MFDVDTFVAECIAARAESEPHRAIKEVLDRTVADGSAVADVLRPERAGIERLHVADDLTVLHVVWAPGMRLYPHDHQMWACIGIYTGGEDNTFFRRNGTTLVESGGKSLRDGDTVLLGDDTVHAVTNPLSTHAGTIHIYNGDFFTVPRYEWDPETLQERPFDVDHALQQFADANAALDRTAP